MATKERSAERHVTSTTKSVVSKDFIKKNLDVTGETQIRALTHTLTPSWRHKSGPLIISLEKSHVVLRDGQALMYHGPGLDPDIVLRRPKYFESGVRDYRAVGKGTHTDTKVIPVTGLEKLVQYMKTRVYKIDKHVVVESDTVESDMTFKTTFLSKTEPLWTAPVRNVIVSQPSFVPVGDEVSKEKVGMSKPERIVHSEKTVIPQSAKSLVISKEAYKERVDTIRTFKTTTTCDAVREKLKLSANDLRKTIRENQVAKLRNIKPMDLIEDDEKSTITMPVVREEPESDGTAAVIASVLSACAEPDFKEKHVTKDAWGIENEEDLDFSCTDDLCSVKEKSFQASSGFTVSDTSTFDKEMNLEVDKENPVFEEGLQKGKFFTGRPVPKTTGNVLSTPELSKKLKDSYEKSKRRESTEFKKRAPMVLPATKAKIVIDGQKPSTSTAMEIVHPARPVKRPAPQDDTITAIVEMTKRIKVADAYTAHAVTNVSNLSSLEWIPQRVISCIRMEHQPEDNVIVRGNIIRISGSKSGIFTF